MKARKALIFPLALLSAALLLPTPGSAQFEVGQRSVDECPCERRHPPVEEDVCVVEGGQWTGESPELFVCDAEEVVERGRVDGFLMV